MTREEIIRMAREAGLQHREAAEELYSPHCDGIYLDDLDRFAALVAAAEREACAEICDRRARRYGDGPNVEHWAQGFKEGASVSAAKIRARGQK